VQRAPLDDRGFQFDRRWMLVDDDGLFISQREAHRMALIDVSLAQTGLSLAAPGMEALLLPTSTRGARMQVRIWKDEVEAVAVDRESDEWFSTFLERRCRIVFMPPQSRRIVNRAYMPEERLVGFADAYPLMLIGDGSLAGLNERLTARGESAVPIKRFRPNILIAGTTPHQEDEWKTIRIGEIDIDIVKPCERCAITTVDVNTGEAGPEPLRTLSTYRKQGSKVMFGQNAVHRGPGMINVGDPVTVLS
jgi:hypothetical protein